MRLLVAAAVLSIAASAADAQESSQTPPPAGSPMQPQAPPPTTGMGNAQSPIGHRQPTQNDLPPSVRDREDSPQRGAPDPFGPLPQICRNC
jgi:hypothetical protein